MGAVLQHHACGMGDSGLLSQLLGILCAQWLAMRIGRPLDCARLKLRGTSIHCTSSQASGLSVLLRPDDLNLPRRRALLLKVQPILFCRGRDRSQKKLQLICSNHNWFLETIRVAWFCVDAPTDRG